MIRRTEEAGGHANAPSSVLSFGGNAPSRKLGAFLHLEGFPSGPRSKLAHPRVPNEGMMSMKGNEHDELLRRRVDAVERQAWALEAAERRLQDAERTAQARLLRNPPRRLFWGDRGTILLLRSIPGFAELWEKRVPDAYLRETTARDGSQWCVLHCVCGEQLAMMLGTLADCSCGRFFFHVGSSVRVKAFPLEECAA